MLMRTAQLSVFLLLMTGGAGLAAAQSRPRVPREDTQSRPEVELAIPLYRGLELLLGGDLRAGRVVDARFLRGDVGVSYSYKPSKHVTLRPFYTYRALQEFTGPNENENRFSFEGKASVPFSRFVISDVNLFERRLRSSGNSTRYRNLLKVELPVKFGSAVMELFISDEVYYEWKDNAWTRNRFRIGADKKFGQRVETALFYMRQNDGFSRPGDIHIVGIETEINFR
ncbi:MAG: DUF2490 domain-containing protein [Pyrinomonadaceae bacterium]